MTISQMETANRTTSRVVRPRALAHRGVVEAAAFLFPLSTLDEREARQRILRLWVPGASVLRVADNSKTAHSEILVLKLPQPLRVNCSHAPGTPLVAQSFHSPNTQHPIPNTEYRTPNSPSAAPHGLLTAMPLLDGEAMRLNAPEGSVIVARGGIANTLPLENAGVEDPADWLDIAAWQWTRAHSLGLPPAPIRDIAARQEFDARARLTKGAAEDAGRRSVIEALRQAAQRQRNGNSENSAGAGQDGKQAGGKGSAGTGSASPLGGWLSRLFGQKSSGSGGASGPEQAGGMQGRNSLLDTANRLAARLAMLTGLSRLIGRKQAAYLKRMMDMFEKGDFDQALRHAIGFSDLEGMDTPPLLRAPTPRADLTISPHVVPASGNIGLPGDWTEHLRKLYRQAFERLERDGRIEEAAFVLAELLSAHEEAVNFLEKHRRFQLAAEIAEARNLPPGLVTRQWFLADEPERAVQIARRTGAFADAVLRLERADKERAAQLRWLWAQSLAEAGNYYGAFGVVKPALDDFRQDEERRATILEWLDNAVKMGGAIGAEALARQFSLLDDMTPEAAANAREQALLLLKAEDEENARARLVFALKLTDGPATPHTLALARAALRACLRDVGMGFQTNMDGADYARMQHFAGDAALKADLPPLPKLAARPALSTTPVFTFPVEDAGALHLTDAAFLLDGRCLAALGEIGVRLLTRDGRTITHWDTPAHQLVVSDVGNRALLLAARGDLWRIARLDLTTRKLQQWGTANLGAFAPDYDGDLWFVAMDKDFLALDATAAEVAALWRLPNLEGGIKSIARSPDKCSFLLFAAGATDQWGRATPLWTRLEKWTHSLPDLMLRERGEVTPVTGEPPNSGEAEAQAGNAPSPAREYREYKDYAQSIAANGDVFQWKVEGVESPSNVPVSADNFASSAAWLATLLRPHAPNDARAPATIYREQIIRSQAFPLPPLAGEKWIWLALRSSEGIEGRLLTRPQGTLKACFQLRGASHVTARFTPTHLTLADDRGRLLVLELDSLKLVRDLRLS